MMFTLRQRLLTPSCVSNRYYMLHIFSGSVFASVRGLRRERMIRESRWLLLLLFCVLFNSVDAWSQERGSDLVKKGQYIFSLAGGCACHIASPSADPLYVQVTLLIISPGNFFFSF